jgi:NaMN:DMB phosphoribosyltransferase
MTTLPAACVPLLFASLLAPQTAQERGKRLIDDALAIQDEMATFAEAGVSRENREVDGRC